MYDSLSSKESRQIPERDNLGPPVVAGGQEIGFLRFGIPKPSRTSHGRLGDWDGGLSPLEPTKACHMAKRRVGV